MIIAAANNSPSISNIGGRRPSQYSNEMSKRLISHYCDMIDNYILTTEHRILFSLSD